MGPFKMTAGKWIDWSKNYMCQYLVDNGKMIGFWLARPNFKTKEVDRRILAIDPDYKGKHLGHSLSHERGFTIYSGKISTTNTFRLCTLGQIDEQDIKDFFVVLKEALKRIGV